MTPEQLLRLRRRLKLSQAGMAELTGIAANTIARWERGEMGMRPAMEKLIKLTTRDAKGPAAAKRSKR